MKVLSLFDGMACGMLAFQLAGIKPDRYVAYEYDIETANEKKDRPFGFAAKVASHNFPMIEQCGDVFKADYMNYQDFDWLIGGSPCTYWSIAQKNNRETEASGLGWELFCQYVRALHEVKPKYFLYENNKSMSKEIRASITATFGFEPIGINSSLVSAQNRQRLYWVGKQNEDGTYSKVDIEQPDDRKLLLRNIVLNIDLVEKKSFWSEKAILGNENTTYNTSKSRLRTLFQKSPTICARDWKDPKSVIQDGTKRKLVVREYARLQTVPEWYDFSVISDSQAYRCLGNGWTIEVIAHLIKSAIN